MVLEEYEGPDLNKRIDEIFRRAEHRLTSIVEKRLAALECRVASLESRVGNNTARIDTIVDTLANLGIHIP